MKTAIEQAREQVNMLNALAYHPEHRSAIKSVLNILTALLPVEREQIEQAYIEGAKQGVLPYPDFKDASTYFTTTFKNS